MTIPSKSTREIILTRSAALFAYEGKEGASMRDIAREVGVTIAALYHHFPDKQALYLSAIVYAFGEKMTLGSAVLDSSGTAWERLKGFVEWIAKLLSEDEIFARLLHRELLDGNEERLKQVTEKVFGAPLKKAAALIGEIAPRQDAHMLAISLVSLVLGHVQLRTIHHLVAPQGSPRDDPERIANHVMDLIMNGIEGMSGQDGQAGQGTVPHSIQNAK